jgi:putative oxidoreductase
MMTNTMSSTATAQHPTPGVLARIAAIGARLGRFPLAMHQLLFRFAIAGVFLRAGLDKVRSWESTVALFRDEYKVPVLPPEVAAAMASTFEIGCSVLLVIGLASRLATLPMLGMITVGVLVFMAWFLCETEGWILTGSRAPLARKIAQSSQFISPDTRPT